MIALSLIASGTAWAADENLVSGQNATANVVGATSGQISSTNMDDLGGSAGETFTGVISVLQNGGANSVINNGNAVSAIINAGNSTTNEMFAVGSDQDKSVQSATVNSATSSEEVVTDDNNIAGSAFRAAAGIVSAVQNNGANSAINNGNAVSAVVKSGDSSQPNNLAKTFEIRAFNSAKVEGSANVGTSAVSIGNGQAASTNQNTIAGAAFQNYEGIASVAQNNGANSAINNGNAVAGMVTTGVVKGSLSFNVVIEQEATVEGRVANRESDFDMNAGDPAGNFDSNQISADAFEEFEGIVSVAQNNGANSAINNGNGVAGIVNSDQVVSADNVAFDSDGLANSQAALIGGPGALVQDFENSDSPNENLIDFNAFQNFEGVASVVQNNGPNSAINNGNAVSAIVLSNGENNAESILLDADSAQSASIDASGGFVTANADLGQTDANLLIGNAFRNASGVSSLVQNNGSNAALNNGNTVSAYLGEENSTSAGDANVLFADQNVQAARVTSGANGGVVRNIESSDARDANAIAGNSFDNATGVHSIVQNNGANSAINNGNSVSAVIASVAITEGASSLAVSHAQSAQIVAQSDQVSNTENNANDTNAALDRTFQTADGVASVFQNNGANSAVSNGNTVALLLSDNGVINVDAKSFDGLGSGITQAATVDGASAVSNAEQAGALDTNVISDWAFESAEGIFSVGQNNGPNSAINNGNTVASAIADESTVNASLGAVLNVQSSQNATVGMDGTVSSIESGGSNDTNTINAEAFRDAAGVFSVLQNNGPNSAINNGNSVAAIISHCPQCTGANSFTTAAVSSGIVGPGADAIYNGVTNTNELLGNAFQNTRGIVSVTQNNGANAALSNGNVVSAIVDPS